jgi:DNA-binding Xre family transcriptional regulator
LFSKEALKYFMLIFNLSRVFKLRGIERPYSFLKKHGFAHMSASNFANGNVVQPHIAHIEALCRILNCTPNDFFEWTDETGSGAIEETHSLNTLRREKKAGLKDLIKEIPLDKLPEVEEFLKKVKSEK